MRNGFCNGNDDALFDGDYIALIAILSVALEAYGLQQADRQAEESRYLLRMADKATERLDNIEGKLKTIERLLERSIYNGR